jgi:hypothetical protein
MSSGKHKKWTEEKKEMKRNGILIYILGNEFL